MDKEMIRFHAEAAWRALRRARTWHENPDTQQALGNAAEYLEALRDVGGGVNPRLLGDYLRFDEK
jgi:hypothetical protein